MADEPRHRLHPTTLRRARELRQSPAPAEHALWRRLRNRQLSGLKFRRQVPLGPYVADFLCQHVKLVIELDGPSHDERESYDQARTT